jgi:large conductance mechanosensitive channel
MRGFKAFLLRGNVVELAVAVVIGVAFNNLVSTFVISVITPVISAILGRPGYTQLSVSFGRTLFPIGLFLNALVSFVIIAFVVYFLVVLPYQTLMARTRREPTPDPTIKKCPECLSEIPIDARRCAFCTQPVG